ncbi:replicative DNA helicase [Sansalvadorimonas sp. 2012CJ34-2]|uniref:Replicative DNA helicase n=1 Tax=Parendozoicomonas callyspongiae TaxID=2942213 RepID=A0ABT0PIG9_9GAMM|nr:replicative DNA helicase [Sansalvadorimonas sp. 2012CJ34-2]MCL6271190.1 replicative DNA helicase [Sansalvadorimonas sp. 2012CJ34-2]
MLDTELTRELPIDEALANLKTPPHSIEAEQSVLGGLMLDNESWDKIGDKVTSEDFYNPAHRKLFECIQLLAQDSSPFDPITVAEELDRKGHLEESGGMGYLTELVESIPSVANLNAYADIVYERAVLRRLISSAQRIADAAYAPEGRKADDLVELAEREVFNIAESRAKEGGPVGAREILKKTVEKIDELFKTTGSITGITSGFKDLDEMTAGFQSSDMVVLAARPSMGKTTFAMNLIENALMSTEECIVVFSLEMPSEQLMMRSLASLGRIDQGKVRTGKLEDEDWPKLSNAVKSLKEKKLFIDDTAGISPQEMRTRLRRIHREHGKVAMVMVDYLQLMQIPGFSEGRTNEISEISRSIKAMAKEFECPVIALSQLNRSLEQRPNKRPVNSDLRESGAIEQDADVIMFIYRDEVYNPDTEHKGVAEIIIGKQRNGPIGSVRLAFMGRFSRFENLAPEAYGNFDDD